LWGRRGGAALAALGAAAGAALLATVLAAGVAVEDQSLQQGITRVPEGERAARVVWGGIPTDAADRFRALDRGAAGALANATGRRPTAFMLYREWRIRGDLVDLGAGDHLERWVRLRSGRLPKTCRPERCEVVQLAGGGRLASAPGLRLVRVGTGSLRSRAPFGDLVTSETSTSILAYSQRYHRPAAPPFVLAEGVAATARIKYLADDYRSYSWVVPLRSGMLHPWSVDRFEQALTTARSRLAARSHFFSLTAPEAELDSAQRTGRVGGRRLFLLGGEAAALLLAFSVLTASALRRSAEIGRRRLTWLGARRWQLALETLTDVLALAVVGTIVGWLAGAAPAALVARHLGSDAGGILAHSLIAPTGIAVAAALAIAAAVVLLATLAVPAVRLGATSLNVLDVAAIGAVVAIVVALSRGSTDTSALADTSGTRTTLLLLPALFAFVAAVVAARAVGVLPRVLERLARRGPLPSRLALLSLARNPGRAAAAVGFLVVSVGLALFAGVYRSTLLQGQRDEAAFAFPRSVVVAEDYSQLVPVLRAAPMARYETHGRVDAVIRQSGDVPGLGSSAFTLLGLSAPTLPTIAGWRGDFSSNSLGALAEKLEVDGPSALRTVRVPASARQLELPADVRATVGVRAQIIGRDGRLVTVPLAAAGPRRLAGSIPRDARGGDLIAFAFEPRNSRLSLGANSVRGRRPFEPGAVVLGIPRVIESTGSRRLRVDYSSWTGTDGVAAHARGGRASLRFLVTPELDTRFRLRQPLEGRALPVVVSPRLAAAAGPDGILPLDVEGERLVTRVAGTASRFPGTSGDFVVADPIHDAPVEPTAPTEPVSPTRQHLGMPRKTRRSR